MFGWQNNFINHFFLSLCFCCLWHTFRTNLLLFSPNASEFDTWINNMCVWALFWSFMYNSVPYSVFTILFTLNIHEFAYFFYYFRKTPAKQIHFCHYCCCYYFFHHQYVKPLQKQTIELIQMENHQKEMFYFSCFFVFVCLMLQNMKESKKRKRNENMVKKNQNNEHTKISFFFD